MLRVRATQPTNILKVSDLVLDRLSHTVSRAGKNIVLSVKEFEVLEYLMKHHDEVLPRERIESDVWETDYCGLSNVIDVYIRYLRKKIDGFLELIENFRKLEKEIPLNELIWKIYSDTNYYNYVGLLNNGGLKQANLKMLFERAKQ